MDPNREISLLIPTKNKSFRLEKTVRYLHEQRFAGPILIDDASTDEHLNRNRATIASSIDALDIRHTECRRGMQRSYLAMLEAADTRYVLFAGDDDFFPAESLRRCAQFLDSSREHVGAWGKTMRLYANERPDGSFEPTAAREYYSKPLLGPTGAARILEATYPHILITSYSVGRINPVRDSWRTCVEAFPSENDWTTIQFFEPTFNALTYLKGKLAHLPGLFHAMLVGLRPISEGYPEPSRFRALSTWDWANHLPAMEQLIAEELARVDAMDPTAAAGFAQAVWWAWAVPALTFARQELLRTHGVDPSVGRLHRWAERGVRLADHLQRRDPRATIDALKRIARRDSISIERLRGHGRKSRYQAEYAQIETILRLPSATPPTS
jgi:glycosyltransferase domain-containing protein